MGSEAEEIRERLALVERSMRRYRTALAAMGLIAVAALAGPSLVGAAKVPAVIQAKAFQMVDDSGRVRAMLATVHNNTRLDLFDEAGKARVVLDTAGNTTGLHLYDEAGKGGASLETASNTAVLYLFDEASKRRVRLETAGGTTGLYLNDDAQKLRVRLNTTGHITGLYLFDKARKERVILGNIDLQSTATGSAEHRSASSLVLFDEHGRVLWQAP